MTDQPEVKDAEEERRAKHERFIQAVLAKINWDNEGLIPAVTQDVETGLVLQIGWLNAEALRLTLEKREIYFWEPVPDAVIHQGADKNAVQKLAGIYVAYDSASILFKVLPTGSVGDGDSDTYFDRPLDELLAD